MVQVGGFQGEHSSPTALRGERLQFTKGGAPHPCRAALREGLSQRREQPQQSTEGFTWVLSWLQHFALARWDSMRPGCEQLLGSCKLRRGQDWEMLRFQQGNKEVVEHLGDI